MEFFNKAKVIRLRSHLDKYLLADDDGETVRQTRNASPRNARWTVEFVDGKSHVVRMKSCHGMYLAAADEPFLLGMTGKKVVQTHPAAARMDNSSVEWEPIKEGGYLVKLRTKGGKFLRANGGTPPWRNSITHDVPHRTATRDWVLWEVEVVDISLSGSESFDSVPSYVSPTSSFSSLPGSDTRSPSITSNGSAHSCGRRDGMQYFDKAKAVRLQSHHGKYLVADDDEKTVRQSRNGSSNKARWTVEFVVEKNHVIRLKSCHGRYLTAVADPFLLGMTGKKVIQSLPATKIDTATEWEPLKEVRSVLGVSLVKLRSSEGKFLRANGGAPPWRNSVTHDVPHRTATQDWVLWGVDVLDISLSEFESLSSCVSWESSFTPSLGDDFMGSPDTGSPLVGSDGFGRASARQTELVISRMRLHSQLCQDQQSEIASIHKQLDSMRFELNEMSGSLVSKNSKIQSLQSQTDLLQITFQEAITDKEKIANHLLKEEELHHKECKSCALTENELEIVKKSLVGSEQALL